MYREASIDTYVADAAAGKPAPGGGSVSALAGALAAAMSAMSANFTVGKKRFADVEETARRLLGELEEAREALLELMERDVEAYSAVSDAYSLPKESEEQKATRAEAIGRALRAAMEVPLDVMRRCAAVASVADELVEVGNRNLITDVGVSAILAEAACAAARLNVEVNLKFLKEPELRREVEAEMEPLSRAAAACRDRVSRKVTDYLWG